MSDNVFTGVRDDLVSENALLARFWIIRYSSLLKDDKVPLLPNARIKS
jgi:hypothetical protein